MKKNLLIGAASLIVSIPTFAGDYLTNTNQNAAFLRMIARGASIDVDGVYSNPAGLAFLPEDGFHLSLTGQSAYQTREILATSPLWIIIKVLPLPPSSRVSMEPTRKTNGSFLLRSPSPEEVERPRSTTDFRCSMH